jgi:1-deoxy-D-xylulose-5-phosphate synthase
VESARFLKANGINCAVIDARFAKPLDTDLILEVANATKRVVTVEENVLTGGFGSAVLSLLSKNSDVRCLCIGIPDEFVEHGTQEILRADYGLDKDGIISSIRSYFPDLVYLPTPSEMKG